MAVHVEHSEHAEHGGHAGHHVTPIRTYLIVFTALMILLFATVGAALFDLSVHVPIPGINIIVMLVIAIIKAALVVLFFMEVLKGSRLVWLWAAIGFFWVLTMLVTLGDYLTRNWITVSGW